ncbi:MAG: glycosyltransferase family 2 protein [Cyanobacteria bacterium HKST-UBA06]|nr:glycosyltransferase family 2 protein [Cyanobacteria bacterium HKST-UBA04]MCA9808168.1 glycosyltransferase family 2 protein [Cyanobacteria bacterium HKST-UBA06]
MKLVILIPCWNEAEHLAETLAHLPRQVDGFDTVAWLLVDDGSTDASVARAQAAGVDYIEALPKHVGLAKAFAAGLRACLQHGADVIVTVDADNQHDPAFIPDLVRPIVAGQADVVVGERQRTGRTTSLAYGVCHWLGSFVVRCLSGLNVYDVPSGFRAYSKEAASQFQIRSRYTYTAETLLQAGWLGLSTVTVPVSARPSGRPSRLIRSLPEYVFRAAVDIAGAVCRQCKNRVWGAGAR